MSSPGPPSSWVPPPSGWRRAGRLRRAEVTLVPSASSAGPGDFGASAATPAAPEAPTEAPAVDLAERPPVGLYVHVPFCVSVCPYCDFVVLGGAAARGPANRLADFVEALTVELALRADALDAIFPDRPPLDTLYLGGGTPSLLGPEPVARIVGLVRSRYGLAPHAEVTLEANPGHDERGDARGFVEAGVTRISYGVQSLDPAELRRLGRRHAPAEVAEAVAEARAAGVGSLNLDLLYDLPDAPVERFAASLEAALALAPDHLSCYALTLEDPDAEGLTGSSGDHLPVRPGARRWRRTAAAAQDQDRAAACYGLAADRLAAAGLARYELSNWARPGHESRHNLAYWHRQPVAAAGPGAHGFDGRARWWNGARLEPYLRALVPSAGSGEPAALPPGGVERLDAATAAAEARILGLRLETGIDAALAAEPAARAAIDWARGEGLVAETGGRIRLTERGRLLSNELFARLL